MLNRFGYYLGQRFDRLSLGTVLGVISVVQVASVAGLVGYFSQRDGQRAVNETAQQLRAEISNQIQQKLTSYLAIPESINQLNAEAIRQSQLKTQDRASERYLWHQMQVFPRASWIYYGAARDGSFVGIKRLSEQHLQIAINDATNQFQSSYYRADSQGRRGPQEQFIPGRYDARRRPWYQGAIATNPKSYISPIYPDHSQPQLILSFTLSVSTSAGEVLGVTGVDYSLRDIGHFLNQLRIGKSGQAFIIERSGLLVADSTATLPYRVQGKDIQRVAVVHSPNDWVRNVAQQLHARRLLETLQTPVELEFQQRGQRFFTTVVPYQRQGIDWLVVVTIPEADFTEQIQANHRQTLLLCLGTVMVAAAISYQLARWLTRPLQDLTQSAIALRATKSFALASSDQLPPPLLAIKGSAEVRALTHSFNQMSQQLRSTLASLEQRVQERTMALQQEIVERERALAELQQAQAELAASEERWQLALQGNNDGIWDIDLSTGKSFYSTRWKEMLGYQEAEVSNTYKEWIIRVHPDDLDTVMQANQEHLQGLTPYYQVEYRLQCKDGSYKWILSRGKALWNSAGVAIRMVGSHTDITDRKRTEDELRRNATILEIAQTVAHIGSWEIDCLTDERIWSRQMFEIFGLPPQPEPPSYAELLACIHPEDRFRWQRAFSQLQNHGNCYELDLRILRPNGEVKYVEVRGKAIRNSQGAIIRLEGTALDISDRKRREESLRLIVEGTAATTGVQFFQACVRYLAEILQVRYALVTQRLETAPDRVRTLSFWVGDSWSEPIEYSLAQTPCEGVIAGKTCYYPNHVSELFPEDPELIKMEVVSYLGVPLTNAAGQVLGHLAVLDVKPMQSDPTRELILRIFAARTGAELERQFTQEALEMAKKAAETASQAKSQFLANMSHELRTPFNAILGYTQLLLRDAPTNSSQHHYLEIINNNSENLLQLINSVLDMSKIEAGQITLTETEFDFHFLLESIEELLQMKAAAKGLFLVVDLAPNVPQYLQADEGKLRQVFINLLGNAIKFTETGGVALRVGYHPPAAADTRPWLQVEVEDTGPGIADPEIERLFDVFVQAEAGQKAREGAGLGLAIARQFVTLMGGRITASSTLGQGSTFRFDIPIRLANAASVHPRLKPQANLRLAPGQPAYRILVVEDKQDNRELLVKLLESAGFPTKAATNGKAAIALWQSWQPHLIWMDLRMPTMDGYEATRQIRAKEAAATAAFRESCSATEPPPAAVKIIALTASVYDDEQKQILKAGCDAYLRKPFRPETIYETMARFLGVQYEVVPSNEPAPRESISILNQTQMVGALSTLPQAWLAQLKQSATQLDEDAILDLIQQIPPNQTALAQTLIDLVKNVRFDSIIHLINQVVSG